MYNEDLKINKLELTLEPNIFIKIWNIYYKLGYLYNDAQIIWTYNGIFNVGGLQTR